MATAMDGFKAQHQSLDRLFRDMEELPSWAGILDAANQILAQDAGWGIVGQECRTALEKLVRTRDSGYMDQALYLWRH